MAVSTQPCPIFPHQPFRDPCRFTGHIPTKEDPRVARRSKDQSRCRWERPQRYFAIVINCDASVRPQDGKIGYGCIIRDNYNGGEVIRAQASCESAFSTQFHGPIVLYSEMAAILYGLRELLKRVRYLTPLEVQSDSKTAVEIVTGLAPCPKECENILEEIRNLSGIFPDFSCMFVYREQNRAADFMSRFMSKVSFAPYEIPYDLMKIAIEEATGPGIERVKRS